VIDLLMGLGLIGAVTIWPAKIGVLYAALLCVAIFSINRLNRRLDEVDRRSHRGAL
jgi:hypothetical protein